MQDNTTIRHRQTARLAALRAVEQNLLWTIHFGRGDFATHRTLREVRERIAATESTVPSTPAKS